MKPMTPQTTPGKKRYVPPQLVVKGKIAELTQKKLGYKDSMVFDISNGMGDPAAGYS